MNKKDIVVISVLVNAGLLVILLISALTSRESYLVSSSAKVASDILQKDAKGMVETTVAEEGFAMSAEENLGLEGVVHQLPEAAFAPVENNESVTVDLAMPQEMQRDQNVGLETGTPSENVSPENVLTESANSEVKCIEIKVKSGDSLDRLARRYHVTIKEIQKANNLSNSFLKQGQNLKIPVTTGRAAKIEASSSSRYYTVKPGESPWTIAMKHHLKVGDLLKMNNLDNRKAKRLRPGDKLRVR